MVSSCRRKRQIAKREGKQTTRYTADILTAADARNEREREGQRHGQPTNTSSLALSLSLSLMQAHAVLLTLFFDLLSL